MMHEYGLPIIDTWQCDCNWERNKCFNRTIELMGGSDRPTAIFVASDHMAIACMSALYQLNIRVPEDVSIIGISNIEEAKYMNPPLTTIDIPKQHMSEIVVQTLLQRLNGDLSVPKQIYLPTSLIERQSVIKI